MVPVKVVIHGASGKVGQVLVDLLSREPSVKLVGAVDAKASASEIVLSSGSIIPFSTNLERILKDNTADVVVDFSLALATMPAVRIAAKNRVNLVIGTTGLSAENIEEIGKLALSSQIGVVLASNFAMGAVLMMYFARIAAKYMDSAEIIELHHQTKADAPSGTALNTARAMAETRGRPFTQAADAGKNYPSRGQNTMGVPVHSVRLPGLMAHQEVILGSSGQTLILRHDTINRECYVPGVLLAVQEVVKRKGLIQGLDTLLGF